MGSPCHLVLTSYILEVRMKQYVFGTACLERLFLNFFLIFLDKLYLHSIVINLTTLFGLLCFMVAFLWKTEKIFTSKLNLCAFSN